jgi:disulfide bond formation protein DsbB
MNLDIAFSGTHLENIVVVAIIIIIIIISKSVIYREIFYKNTPCTLCIPVQVPTIV